MSITSHILRTTALVVLLASTASSHGGRYIAPGDSGTGSSSGGGTVGPPTNPGGALAPAGAATSGGLINGTGARTSDGRGARGGSVRRAAVTSSSGGRYASAGWELWWARNRDRFLGLRDRLVRRGAVTGGITALTGKGRRSVRSASLRPDRLTVRDGILPPLLDLLATSTETDILDSSVLAIARSAEPEAAPDLLPALLDLVGHRELSVQSATTLALGALGAHEARPVLHELLVDGSEGRRLAGSGSVPTLTRCFAAFALGLLGDPDDAPMLVDLVERTRSQDREVRIACLEALGLVGARAADPAPVRTFLVRCMTARAEDRMVQAHAATALGRLGDREAIAPLVAALEDRDADQAVRRAAVVALGALATPDDAEAVEALASCSQHERDRPARHLALVSLGEVATRRAADTPYEAVAKPVERLLEQLADGDQERRGWAALGLGILGGALVDAQGQPRSAVDEAMRTRILDRMRDAYDDQRAPDVKAALALGLGLLRDEWSVDALREDYRDTQDARLKGHIAVALGLLDDVHSAGLFRADAAARSTEPTLRVDSATALGLLGDGTSVRALVEGLQSAPTLGVVSGIARALGLVGDESAIAPLVDLARDGTRPPLTRGFACVALGLLGERTELPFATPLLAHGYHLTESAALAELMDIP